jgi:ABC-2 type transport system ATP-binding protein
MRVNRPLPAESGPAGPAIETQGLTKSYVQRVTKPGLLGSLRGLFYAERRQVSALKGLDLRVARGEAVGLIGENGAGKSTTMKLLTGILRPSSGSLGVLGHQPSRERKALARKIGVVFGQRPQLLWDIAVRETFELLRVMYRIPDAVYAETSALATKLLDLGPLLGVPVRQLSLGQRMRADLACAFLHAPQLVFLDEPTIGLDVLAKEQARTLIKTMRRRHGMTLMLTTHDLKDITDTCQRVVLLDKGSLLFDGSLEAFEGRFAREKRIVVQLDRPLAASARLSLKAQVRRLGGRLQRADGLEVAVAYESPVAVRRLTQLLVQRLEVADMAFEKSDMESIVRKIYGRQGSKRG